MSPKVGEASRDSLASMSCDTVTVIESQPSCDFLLRAHLEDYDRTCRDYARRLTVVWDDVGLSGSEHDLALGEITKSALGVWDNALERAEEGRCKMRQSLAEALEEISELTQALADDNDDEIGVVVEVDDAEGDAGTTTTTITASTTSSTVEQEMNSGFMGGGAGTLRERYEDAIGRLEAWRERKARRMGEFDAVLEELGRIRARIGEPMPASAMDRDTLDISVRHLQYLRLELEKSRAEKLQREKELEVYLGRLKKICFELDENYLDMAGEVHPSLKHHQDLMQNLSTFRPSHLLQIEPHSDDHEPVEMDLSESTFSALDGKIAELKNVKIVRQQQAVEMNNMLRNLWTALEVPHHDVERVNMQRLLEGPSRLHTSTLTKCMKEVQRLERAQAQLLLGLIHQKKSELEELCKKTHLPMPDVSPLLVGGDGQTDTNCGIIADNLAKLVRMVAEVNLMCDKRSEIVKTIDDLQLVMDEVEWLCNFERDRRRYSARGREQNRKLQRALKAGKIRDKLPEKLKQLDEAIASWEYTEKQPFIYDGKNYRVEVLERLIEDIVGRKAGKFGSKKAPKPGCMGRRNSVRSASAASAVPSTCSGSSASTVAATRSASAAATTTSRIPVRSRKPTSLDIKPTHRASKTEADIPRVGRFRSSILQTNAESSKAGRSRSSEVPRSEGMHTRKGSAGSRSSDVSRSVGLHSRKSSGESLSKAPVARSSGPSVKAAAARLAAKAVASVTQRSNPKSAARPSSKIEIHTRTSIRATKSEGQTLASRISSRMEVHTRTCSSPSKSAISSSTRPITRVVAKTAADSRLITRGSASNSASSVKATIASRVTGEKLRRVPANLRTTSSSAAAQETEPELDDAVPKRVAARIGMTKAKADAMQESLLAKVASGRETQGFLRSKISRPNLQEQLRSRAGINGGQSRLPLQSKPTRRSPDCGDRRMPYNPLQERLNKLMQSAEPLGVSRIPQLKNLVQKKSPRVTPRRLLGLLSSSRSPRQEMASMECEPCPKQDAMATVSDNAPPARRTPVGSEHEANRESTHLGGDCPSLRVAMSTANDRPSARDMTSIDSEQSSLREVVPLGGKIDAVGELPLGARKYTPVREQTPVAGDYKSVREQRPVVSEYDAVREMTPFSGEDDPLRGMTPGGRSYSPMREMTAACSGLNNPGRDLISTGRGYTPAALLTGNTGCGYTCNQDPTRSFMSSPTRHHYAELAGCTPSRDVLHRLEQTQENAVGSLQRSLAKEAPAALTFGGPGSGPVDIRHSTRYDLHASRNDGSLLSGSLSREGIQTKAAGFSTDGRFQHHTKSISSAPGNCTPVNDWKDGACSSLSMRSVDVLAGLYGKDSTSSVGSGLFGKETGITVTNGVYEKDGISSAGIKLYGKEGEQEVGSLRENNSRTGSNVRLYERQGSSVDGMSFGREPGTIRVNPKDLMQTSAFARVANLPLTGVHDSFNSTRTPRRELDSHGRLVPPHWSVVYCNGCYLDSPWSEDGTTVDAEYHHNRLPSINSSVQSSASQVQNVPAGLLSGFMCNPMSKCFHVRGESDLSSSLSRRLSL